jgi:hypothetical protein
MPPRPVSEEAQKIIALTYQVAAQRGSGKLIPG